jgi:hypothetical protein
VHPNQEARNRLQEIDVNTNFYWITHHSQKTTEVMIRAALLDKIPVIHMPVDQLHL